MYIDILIPEEMYETLYRDVPNIHFLHSIKDAKSMFVVILDSPDDANLKIKSAARMFGALRCGITKRDKRWDYDPIYDASKEKELYWDKDFLTWITQCSCS